MHPQENIAMSHCPPPHTHTYTHTHTHTHTHTTCMVSMHVHPYMYVHEYIHWHSILYTNLIIFNFSSQEVSFIFKLWEILTSLISLGGLLGNSITLLWPGELRVLPELSMLRDINQMLGEYTKNDRVYHGRPPCSHPIGKKISDGEGELLCNGYMREWGLEGLEIINFFHIIQCELKFTCFQRKKVTPF